MRVSEIRGELRLLLLETADIGRFVRHSGVGQSVSGCRRERATVDGESCLSDSPRLRYSRGGLLKALLRLLLLSDWILLATVLGTGDDDASIAGLRRLLGCTLLDQSDLLLMLLHQPVLVAQLLKNIVLLGREIGLVLLQMLE